MKNEILIELNSRFMFDQTVTKIKEQAEKGGWSVPAIHDLQQSLAKSGKQVRPVKVLELCKPEYSGKMLELNDERIISVMMPCRISVYEKDNGKVYVALMNAASLAANLPVNIATVMKDASDEAFGLVKEVTGD